MTVAQRIAEEIESLISRGGWPPDNRMPSVRLAANQWHVSPVTILAAMRLLKNKGLLEKHPGTGRYFVARGPRGVMQPTGKNLISRAERIAQELREELLSGLIAEHGAFPGPKEIRRRFACSFPIASRALGILRTEGWIEERGRRLVLKDPVRSRRNTHVYIAGSPLLPGGMGGHLNTFVSSVRRELLRMQWGEPRFFLSDRPLVDQDAPEDHTVSGLIFMRYRVGKGWGVYLKRNRRIPLVYVNMEESRAGDYSAHRHYFRLLPANADAGLQIGRHLWGLGHHSVAYFTHVDSRTVWDANRLRGLGDVFGESAGGSSRLAVYRAAGKGEHGAIAKQAFNSVNALLLHLASCHLLSHQEILAKTESAYDLASLAAIAELVEPAFNAALADPEITAWVCANDDIACLALQFLGSKGIAVPGHISVAGFDNSPAAGRHNLTSYDFGLDTMGTMAAACLARPDQIRADAFRSLPVRGYLTCRGSTCMRSGGSVTGYPR